MHTDGQSTSPALRRVTRRVEARSYRCWLLDGLAEWQNPSKHRRPLHLRFQRDQQQPLSTLRRASATVCCCRLRYASTRWASLAQLQAIIRFPHYTIPSDPPSPPASLRPCTVKAHHVRIRAAGGCVKRSFPDLPRPPVAVTAQGGMRRIRGRILAVSDLFLIRGRRCRNWLRRSRVSPLRLLSRVALPGSTRQARGRAPKLLMRGDHQRDPIRHPLW